MDGIFSIRLVDFCYTPVRTGGIYIITCLPTGRIYVGSTRCFRIRWRDHIRALRKDEHFSKFQRAFNKHGEQSFVCSVLEFCSPQELREKEQIYLDRLKPWVSGLNHLDKSSVTGWYPGQSSESLDKLRQRMLGNKLFLGHKHTPETVTLVRQVHLGRKCSEETKRKISAKAKGRVCSESAKAKISSFFKGRRIPPEIVAKRVSTNPAMQKGHAKSSEHRLKISLALKGRTLPDVVKQRISKSLKQAYEDNRR